MYSGFKFSELYSEGDSFNDFEFDTVDELGGERTIEFGLDYPMMLSGGI